MDPETLDLETLRGEMGDVVTEVVDLSELRRDKLLADGGVTAAARTFDETKVRRYQKGTKRSGKISGGRFAPKSSSDSGPSGEEAKQQPKSAREEKGADVVTVIDQARLKQALAKANEPDQGDFEWPKPSTDVGKELLGEHADTQSRWTDAEGRYLPERLALHDEIIARFIADAEAVEQENPVSLFMAGGSGAGKTSVLRTLPDAPKNAVLINPDEIKTFLPEYGAMIEAGDPAAASATHEESSDIAKKLLRTVNERGYNAIIDGTGDSGEGKFLQKIEAAQIRGRSARVVLVDIPTDLAVERATERAKRTGRMVPEQEIRKVHKMVAVNFADWQDKVDDWELWANEGEHEPKLVAKRKPGGKRG